MAKQIFLLLSLLCAVQLTQAQYLKCNQKNAEFCALTLLEPSIKSPVFCSDSAQTVIYTVKNILDFAVPFASIKIVGTDDSPLSSVNIEEASSSCFNTLPPSVPANGTCTIAVNILPTGCTGTFPQLIQRELVIDPDGINQGNLTAEIIVAVNNNNTFLAVAVAQNTVNDSTLFSPSPLVVHNATNTWSLVTTGLPGGSYFSATCSGNNDTGICLAGGLGSGPILSRSADGGVTWGNATITLPATSHISGVACTDEGNASTCSVVGVEDTSSTSYKSMMFRSTNGGASWASLSLPSVANNNQLLKTACAKTGTTDVCTAIGADDFSAFPILLVANNGIVSAVSPALAQFISLAGTACTQSNNKIICTAVGNNNHSAAVLYLNTDAGGAGAAPATWGNPLTVSGANIFNATACATKSDNTVVCTAVGSGGLLYVNTDVTNIHGTGTWVLKSVAGINFTSTACKTNNTHTVCSAAGNDASNKAIVYVSTDGGNNWNPQTISVASNTLFTGTACTNNGAQIVCTVAGGAGPTAPCNIPLLYVNQDVGGVGVWQAALPSLSNGGFIGIGASGNSSYSKLCASP